MRTVSMRHTHGSAPLLRPYLDRSPSAPIERLNGDWRVYAFIRKFGELEFERSGVTPQTGFTKCELGQLHDVR